MSLLFTFREYKSGILAGGTGLEPATSAVTAIFRWRFSSNSAAI
jgi:hypothetical protein